MTTGLDEARPPATFRRMPDEQPDRLNRFIEAQSQTYAGALAELESGRKHGHWMWFVFPQLRGLGQSATAQHYGIADLAEARAYLADPVLGPRFDRCCDALARWTGQRSAAAILGEIDAMKLRSSLTLFEVASAGDPVRSACCAALIDGFFGMQRDSLTLALLGQTS